MSSPILIQGALDEEVSYLINSLANNQRIQIAGYEFYQGIIDHTEVVISKTLVGVTNATIATCIGIENFHPRAVINQGIAGAHSENLNLGDIVVGEKCCNINAFKTTFRDKGDGSSPLEWSPNKRAKDIQDANPKLVNLITGALAKSHHNVLRGILGSGDIHNREYDRIIWTRETFGNLCEDMESIGTYSACNKFNVPCVGVRIISNNNLTSKEMDKTQAIQLQKLLIDILSEI